MEIQKKANTARDKQMSQMAEELATLQKDPKKLPSDTLKNPNQQSSSLANGKSIHINQA